MNERFEPIPNAETKFLNRFVYCDQCGNMGEMKILGRDSRAQVAYQCPIFRCSSVIRLYPIRMR